MRAPANPHARRVFDRVYSFVGRRRRESEAYRYDGSAEDLRSSLGDVRADHTNHVRTFHRRRPAPMEPLEVRISAPVSLSSEVEVTWYGDDRYDVEVESVYEEEVGAEGSEWVG